MQVEGQRGECLRSPPATGARVSNTYVTCPCQGDNPVKTGLIPRILREGILPQGKALSRTGMGMRRIMLVGGVTAHLGYDA